MISEVLTVFVQIDATPVGLVFDFRFHDGYQKKITVDRYDLAGARCSILDFAENLARDYYEQNGRPNPSLKIVMQ